MAERRAGGEFPIAERRRADEVHQHASDRRRDVQRQRRAGRRAAARSGDDARSAREQAHKSRLAVDRRIG